jgi:hypothetical protein
VNVGNLYIILSFFIVTRIYRVNSSYLHNTYLSHCFRYVVPSVFDTNSFQRARKKSVKHWPRTLELKMPNMPTHNEGSCYERSVVQTNCIPTNTVSVHRHDGSRLFR